MEWLFKALFLVMTVILVLPVIIILSVLVVKGHGAISWEFLTAMPRNGMTEGGIFPALVGTIWLVGVALLASVPLGVAAAIYLSEYAPDNWLTRVINLAIINLAGVPVHRACPLRPRGFRPLLPLRDQHPGGLPHPGHHDPPGRHRGDPGVPPGGSQGIPGSVLEHGGHPLADHPPGGSPQCHQRGS